MLFFLTTLPGRSSRSASQVDVGWLGDGLGARGLGFSVRPASEGYVRRRQWERSVGGCTSGSVPTEGISRRGLRRSALLVTLRLSGCASALQLSIFLSLAVSIYRLLILLIAAFMPFRDRFLSFMITVIIEPIPSK